MKTFILSNKQFDSMVTIAKNLDDKWGYTLSKNCLIIIDENGEFHAQFTKGV